MARIQHNAEELAGAALAFLGSDPERLARFLDLTGLTPDTIRAAAASPGFTLAVLDHILSDDELVLALSAEAGCRPEEVMAARNRLAGPLADGLRDG
ncbi:MAG: DUF3572 domain-containing protein [Alsobacter sp.]